MAFNTLGLYLRAAILLVATVLCCVGAGVRQYKSKTADYYVYEFKQFGRTRDYSAVFCNALTTRMDTAYAFAVISCGCIGFTFVVMILRMGARRLQFLPLKPLGLISSFCGFVASLITWALIVNVFHSQYCGMEKSFHDAGADLAAGIVLIIVAWILMCFDLLLAVIGALLPAPVSKE